MHSIDYADTPLGTLEIVAENGKIIKIVLCSVKPEAREQKSECLDEAIAKLKTQLEEYFTGKRFSFEIEYELCGTEFEKAVWSVLSEIPYGKTLSYSEVAKRAGRPKACRAVGNAIGRNNLLILIPCHRVIRSDGSIGGFSAGAQNKLILQKLEKILD